MDLETVKQATDRAAAEVKVEQEKIFAWLRRHTGLANDDELRTLLQPLAETAFNAGHSIGWTEAMWKGEGVRLRSKTAWIVAFVMSAAAIAGWWSVL